MFLIAIRAMRNPFDPGVTHLEHQCVSLQGGGLCDVYFDPDRYAVRIIDNTLTVEDAIADLGTLFIFKSSSFSGTLTKPHMFGLPIYYAKKSTGFFASTNVSLLKAFGISLEENTDVLPEYFVFRYVTPPNTLFRNILSLPFGASISLCMEGSQVNMKEIQWTDVFTHDNERYSLEQGVELCLKDLESHFDKLKRGGRSIVCLLSGGLDSSALYKLSRDRLGLQESHSTGYPFENDTVNREKGERHYAETAAAAFGAQHAYHSYSTAQFLNGMVEAINHAEVPLIHLQSILLSLVFKDGFKPTDEIVLNGQGADALVGLNLMYNYFDKKYLIHRELAPLLWLASMILPSSFLPFGLYHRWALKKWNLDFDHPDHALWMMGEFGDRSWVRSYFGVNGADIMKGRLEALSRFKVKSVFDAFSILDMISDVDMTQGIWSHLAAANGKLSYYPFNSPGLIRALVRIPWKEKMSRPKQVMKLLGERLQVPEFILNRAKLGFGVKSVYWSAPGGLAEALLDVAAPAVDVELVRSFQGDDEKRAMIYWNWLNYGLWKRMILNGETRVSIAEELEEAMRQRGISKGRC